MSFELLKNFFTLAIWIWILGIGKYDSFVQIFLNFDFMDFTCLASCLMLLLHVLQIGACA